MDIDQIKSRLETMHSDNNQSYSDNKELIDMFLDNFGKKQGPLDD
jgi:hypothetical protein